MKAKELNISNVWGKIPINEIEQEDCFACVFGHYASICGETGHFEGKRECLKMLRERHNGANLAHLLVILKSCGADKDPWGVKEWKNYAETFKKLETAFENELPSLIGADLSGAELRRADLHGANLSGAELRRADLHGANLSGAELHGANLSGANLIGADFQGAKYNEETILPAGFKPEEEGMVRV